MEIATHSARLTVSEASSKLVGRASCDPSLTRKPHWNYPRFACQVCKLSDARFVLEALVWRATGCIPAHIFSRWLSEVPKTVESFHNNR